MNQPAGQRAQKMDLRLQMPETAAWVEARRHEWGADHVNGCIRRALKGEPGLFYAMEAGHVLGTPFPATHPISEWQSHALVTGTQFAAFMATPSDIGGTHGAH